MKKKLGIKLMVMKMLIAAKTWIGKSPEGRRTWRGLSKVLLRAVFISKYHYRTPLMLLRTGVVHIMGDV